jgi:hypothetical protein
VNDQSKSANESSKGENYSAAAPAKAFDTKPTESAAQKELEKIEKDMSSFEKSSLRWSRVAVILAGLAALFVCAQWIEMHSSSGDTHDLAIAAGKQADAAKAQSEQAKAQTEKMGESLSKTQALIDATNRLADESRRSADAARKFYVLDQRPWIGISNYTCECAENSGTFKIDKLTVSYTNSGRTPAIKVSGKFTFVMRKWSEPIPTFDEEDERQKKAFTDSMKKTPKELRQMVEKDVQQMSGRFYPEGGTLAPNVTNLRILGAGSFFGRDPKLLGPERQMVYALGKITYYDTMTPQLHTTTFCLVEDPMARPGTFSFCAKGQSMN